MPSYGSPPSFNSATSSSDSIASHSTYYHENSELPNYEEALHQPRHLDDESTHSRTLGSLSSPRVTTALAGLPNSLSRTLSNSTSNSSSSTSTSGSASVSASSIATSASTPTLTNPSPPLSLIFDRNSVVSATLHSRTGPRYRISTNNTVTRTDLYELAQEPSTGSSEAPATSQSKTLVASVKRRELLPNIVAFKHREGKTMRLSSWLKRGKGGHPGRPFSAELSTRDGRYTWIANDTHRLALYSHQGGGSNATPSNYPSSFPIDTLTQKPIAYCKTLNDPPTLALVLRDSECSEATQIEIIMSFLVMENKLRQKEKLEEGRRSSMMHALGAHIRLGSVG